MIDLWHGDCLELMKGIPDNSIDMVLTDPPYGTTACKWDTVIDFDLMWEQLKRITKDSGPICMFGTEPFSSHLRMSNIKMFKYDWIWDKKLCADFYGAKHRPMTRHEIVSVFTSGTVSQGGKKPSPYFPIMTRREKERVYTDSVNMNRKNPKSKSFNGKEYKGLSKDKYPTSIIEASNANRKAKIHPTQKPVALLEYLIKTYTLENETVLDFTMGSGSTGVACKNLNRNFIGIEKEEKYFQIAKARINE